MECHPHPPSPRRITRDELLGQLLELATGFSHDMLPKMAQGPYTPRLVVILQFSRLYTRIPAEERAILVEAEQYMHANGRDGCKSLPQKIGRSKYYLEMRT